MDDHVLPELHYQRFTGHLFLGDVSEDNVGQGDLGDCFFLASLAALAKNDPDAIRRGITDDHDGTYTVTLWERKPGGKVPLPLRIRVQPTFPVDTRGAQVFGKGLRSGPNGQELWPALFEKAYATWRRGYSIINEGGDGRRALTSLTGKRSGRMVLNRHDIRAVWKRLRGAIEARHPMVTSTPLTRELRKRTQRADLAGLIEGHYYAVFDAVERSGQRYVRLYTPLVDFTTRRVGTPSPVDNWERTIELRLEDYQRYFDKLVVNGATRA